ncbi:MAG: carboxypeptidase-like regulatory domain-containing protein [Flavobacteriia bacterium]|nr:carboxypeptidase-like regulatory domain-containing protein [Flavobacteriia bacterium]
MKKIIFLISLLLILHNFYGQKIIRDSIKLIQLSGVVVASDSLEQLPFTSIFDLGSRRGTVADYYGYFSLVVFPGDTLLFSYYGYKTSSFIVPDTLKENRYSIIHMMEKDTINLPMVTVYPWPSKEDFARYFVEMKPYDDALRRAQKQLSGENLAFIAAKLSTDPSLSYAWQQNQRLTQLYTQGQMPVNNLLNPYSWATFIDSWRKGELGRK